MPDLTDEMTDVQLHEAITRAAADLMDRARNIQTYPSKGTLSIHFGDGSLESAERLSMLLDARRWRTVDPPEPVDGCTCGQPDMPAFDHSRFCPRGQVAS